MVKSRKSTLSVELSWVNFVGEFYCGMGLVEVFHEAVQFRRWSWPNA